MSKASQVKHVFPRPVEPLPEYANVQARRNLAEKLSTAFGLAPEYASAIANAVVDPAAVRKAIGDPHDPEVERLPVPGGTLLGVRTQVWARKVMPDPRNPRIAPARKHPFAVDPGSHGEDSKFRPLPEPRVSDPNNPRLAELAVQIESREHLEWASRQAAAYVMEENDWQESIESQGVMEAVWLVAITYATADRLVAGTALTTVEGSSRMTAEHRILEVRSADIPFDTNDTSFRAHLKRLNQRLEYGAEPTDLLQLRCERVPALILVSFVPHAASKTVFSTAIKSFVALRHVDPPKPWGAGPENESLADEVLDELYRRGLISDVERAYYAGACTKAEAEAANLSPQPTQRTASIVRLLTRKDPDHGDAIRVAVTSQSTRKRITTGLANDLATALILRAAVDIPVKADRLRRAMKDAFAQSVHREDWEHTTRTTQQLAQDALLELKKSFAATGQDPGPASIELAVRASYALLVEGRLSADRGAIDQFQPDRRAPGDVLDTMRQSEEGILQLKQVLLDFEDGVPMRAVDENGAIRHTPDNQEQFINDTYLRNQFPPAGKKRKIGNGETGYQRYEAKLADLSGAIDALHHAFHALQHVEGDDGRPVVDARGIESRHCEAWRRILAEVNDELVIWSRTFRRAHGIAEAVSARSESLEADEEMPQSWPEGRDLESAPVFMTPGEGGAGEGRAGP